MLSSEDANSWLFLIGLELRTRVPASAVYAQDRKQGSGGARTRLAKTYAEMGYLT